MPRKAKGRTPHITSKPASADTQDCLCLVCRQVGHLVKSCPQFQGRSQGDESFDTKPQTPSPPFNYPLPPNETSTQALCQRCLQLDDQFEILSGNHSSERDQYMEKVKRRMTPIPPLGLVTSVQLLSTCALCRLVFDITYLSSDDLQSIREPESADEGQLALVPAWTLVHLDPAQDLWPRKEWGPHAVCLYTAVTRARSRWQPQIGVHAGVDAMAVVDIGKNGAVGTPILGVEKVDPQTPKYRMIKEWFHRCDALHHITCRPLVSESLKKIKLVDVETRQIVMYPSDGCDYIALSYVWGGVVQPSYKLGDILPTIPATLEDSMVVTRHLGKRYLWADSLCIDQGDKSEKNTQIPLMSVIYTGAWATIFNVTGQSARSGLPRVDTLDGVIPQLSCEIGGKLLLSLMPPLRAQLSESLWNTRAWTFQEGLLSPRRLFFTNHQVYFECNLAQSCESIDDSRSAFHLLSDEARETASRGALHSPNALVFSDPDEEFDGGVLRDPFRPIFASKKQGISESFRIWKYDQLVHGYTEKKMSMDTDALNAFSAILTRFQETHYKKGFVHGLPVEDLPTTLLWIHADEVEPRRRDGFPSWSWAGWDGVVMGTADSCVRGTTHKLRDIQKQYLPPLRVWKPRDDGHPELVYDFSPILQSQGAHEDEVNEEDARDEDAMDKDEEASTPSQCDGGHSPEDSDSWEDTSGSDDADSDPKSVDTDQHKDCLGPSSGSLQGDDEDGDEDGRAQENTIHSKRVSKDDTKKNPVVAFAKMMLEETPLVHPTIAPNELLLQGIVFRLTFMKLGSEYQDPDDPGAEWCRIQVKDRWQDNCLILYGHNRTQLATERQGKQQEFLLLRRTQFDSALMLIDWEGETARRAGVASLVNLDAEALWTVAKPEVRLIKLR